MKIILTAIITCLAINSHATAIDAGQDSLTIENPTYEDKLIEAGPDAAIFICNSVGYNTAVMTKFKDNFKDTVKVSALNSGFSLYVIQGRAQVLAEVKCIKNSK